MSLEKPVKTLNPEVARKIAAGEVIDRPNAVLRELLDNAVDSGADRITVEIAGGGIEKIRVIDNGSGMTKADLENCAKPHATSKISTEEDLLNLSTLGFRGEALSSIAAVSRLSIMSGGWKMRASITEDHILEKTSETNGTIVMSEGLFENIPARRMFLKRPASEGTMCKNTFIEKALPCPEKAFRLISDGEVKLDLPAGQTLVQRFVKATEIREDISLFNETEYNGSKDFSFKLVIGEPSVNRNSKKDISIFVNGRKIQEYALVQAIEYGSRGYFPNGVFPVAALFVNISPDLVDFNIHPAKREVKFKDISDLHHQVSTKVKNFFLEYTQKTIRNFEKEEPLSSVDLFNIVPSGFEKPRETFIPGKTNYSYTRGNFTVRETSSYSSEKTPESELSRTDCKVTGYEKFAESFIKSHPEYKTNHSTLPQETKNSEQENKIRNRTEEVVSFVNGCLKAYTGEKIESAEIQNVKNAEENLSSNSRPQETIQTFNGSTEKPRFLGSLLGTFLAVEYKNSLFIIDKHAAHERILFDRIMNTKEKSQELLIPEEIQTQDDEEDRYLESVAPELLKIGFRIQQEEKGKWKLLSINERWKESTEQFINQILREKVPPKDVMYSIAAMTACKAAVKDGYILDDAAASKIAEGALLLEDPHCPHGRPVYTQFTRDQLFSLVRRT